MFPGSTHAHTHTHKTVCSMRAHANRTQRRICQTAACKTCRTTNADSFVTLPHTVRSRRMSKARTVHRNKNNNTTNHLSRGTLRLRAASFSRSPQKQTMRYCMDARTHARTTVRTDGIPRIFARHESTGCVAERGEDVAAKRGLLWCHVCARGRKL